MKIPKQIEIIGRTINIEFDDNISKLENSSGVSLFAEDKIKLVPLFAQSRNVTQQDQDMIFLHETLHWIFHELDYEKLNEDEEFINRLASVLYQVLKQIEEKK